MLNIISLGAGVQSSTMALMAAKGILTPMPDAAVFSDTGWEPDNVYEYLNILEPMLPFPVHRVMYNEGLKKSQWQDNLMMRGAKRDGYQKIELPVYTQDAATGKKGMVNRICTADYKIKPVVKKVKEIMGHVKNTRLPTEPMVNVWIGISTDEAQRMKPSRYPFITHRWPLIEAGVSRIQCLAWIKDNGFPTPPRSSCIICPFHSDAEWQGLNEKDFEEACQFDEFIRDRGGKQGMGGQLFLHKSCKPLREADLTDPHINQLTMFGNECEGMCGV